MIHLQHAHQLHLLADQLSIALAERQDPFEKATVIVPNRNLQQWLNMQLAHGSKQQVIAALQFENLEALLARMFLPQDAVLLDTDSWVMLTLNQLRHYLEHEDAVVGPVVAYLRQQANLEKGLFELAHRLVRLFREYELSRPFMIQTWQKGGWYVGEDHLVERWQRRLWQDLFGQGGQVEQFNAARAERAARENRTLPRLLPLNVLTMQQPQQRTGPLHLFGQTYIGRFYQLLLRQLGQHNPIFIYALNPCTQFWEDLVTDREAKKLRAKPLNETLWARGYLEEQEKENPLLRAWGRPGREYFRLLNELAQWDIAVDPPEEERRQVSLLKQIQYDTRHRLPLPDQEEDGILHPGGDDSLTILGCASPRREAECIANHIWNLMQADPTLAFNDIGVIASNMTDYQGAIESAFKRIHRIPFNLVDGKFGRATRLMEAIQHLLNLADTQCEREHLFKLFLHPNFQARFPRADTLFWGDHCQRLAIFAGHDETTWRKSETKYFEGDLYSWRQGLLRAQLGQYLHPKTQGLQQVGDEYYAAFPAAAGEEEATTFWLNLTHSLLADLEVMATARLKPSEWAAFTARLCQAYLAPKDFERRDFDAVLDRMQKLAQLDDGLNDQQGMRFATFRNFLNRTLQQLTAFRGQYLADGVTVSSFLPMRPIPFRILFICGLDEQRFPAPAQKETLDLRWAKRTVQQGNLMFYPERELGDLTARERDAYMFLEGVISAKERLVLSYVDRNEATSDPINPSAVLAQLMQWMPAYTGEKAAVQNHPLKAYSQEYQFDGAGIMRSHDAAAAQLSLAQHTRDSLADSLSLNGLVKAPQFDRHLPWPDEYRQVFGLQDPTFVQTDKINERTVRISSLRKFLESPLQAASEAHLHMRQREENDLFHSVPPLKTDQLTRWAFLTDQLIHTFTSAKHMQEAEILEQLNQRLDFGILEGHIPAGPLSAREQESMLQVLRNWLLGSEKLNLQLPGKLETFRLTANDSQSLVVQPLQLKAGPWASQLYITGPSLPSFDRDGQATTVKFKTGKDRDAAKQQYSFGLLDPALDAVVRSAFEQRPSQQLACVFGDGPVKSVSWQMSQNVAESYLANLAEDWLNYRQPYLLPANLAFQTFVAEDGDAWADKLYGKIQSARESDQTSISDQYGPIENWRDFEPPPNLAELLARRFRPLFDAMQPSDGGAS